MINQVSVHNIKAVKIICEKSWSSTAWIRIKLQGEENNWSEIVIFPEDANTDELFQFFKPVSEYVEHKDPNAPSGGIAPEAQ